MIFLFFNFLISVEQKVEAFNKNDLESLFFTVTIIQSFMEELR